MFILRLWRKSILSSEEQTLGALKLSWYKCGHCAVFTSIECFCWHGKAVEYDKYGVLLDQVEAHSDKSLTKHPDF